ncbi:dihydrolipoamide acetyltransferase family protein [Heyndrickxia ginsengihumi]|uniref:dihydrolipoamide acetyltransferase family protein n=1 Tax=Heyndrickxia ginsengihumi TaxID=363870 RepID=UPI003D1ED79A
MATEVIMPKLGMAMKVGTVSQWNKTEGEPVQKGDLIATISSEKIEMDLEAPENGTVLKISVPEGEEVPPGTIIGYIGKENENVSISHSSENPQEQQNVSKVEEVNVNKPAAETVRVQTASQQKRVKISPVARKMAKKAGLDITHIQGSGPGGRIVKIDVLQAIEQTKEAPTAIVQEEPQVVAANHTVAAEEGKKVPVTGMRKVIATRMFDSLQNSAQLTITMKADVTELKALKNQLKDTVAKVFEHKLTITDYVARAVTLALLQHPQMNSTFKDGSIYTYDHVHLGMAVALEKGLVVPVIRNADSLSLTALSKQIKEAADRAKTGQLANEDIQGSTFTISSLGGYDVEFFTPVLNPPEAGILGVGTITDVPTYIGGKLERRSILPLSLTFDHRVLDGAPAAAFLQTVKQYLEEPITILL